VQEEKREVVIRRMLSSELAIEEAAEILGLSVRQVWWLRLGSLPRAMAATAKRTFCVRHRAEGFENTARTTP
jgi:hypothetical protein